jgi:adenylosuccinate synthase
MAKTLEEIREALGKAFDQAVQNHSSISDYEGNSISRGTARADALQAMAQIADSITAMEAQIAFQKLVERAEKDGSQIVIEVAQGLSKDMKLPGAIKLKQPGQS